MKRTRKCKILSFLAFGLVLVLTAAAGICDYSVPDRICMYESGSLPDFLFSRIQLTTEESVATVSTGRCENLCRSKQATARLFGLLPVKSIAVNQISNRTVCPGGMLFGVKFFTRGVIVVGFSDAADEESQSPASLAGLRLRDVITHVGGEAVNSAASLSRALSVGQGAPVEVRFLRGNVEQRCTVTPYYNEGDGNYYAGLLVRDSTAGIGTVTFYDPENLVFAGLGHGICDSDTGLLMPLLTGSVVGVNLSGVVHGLAGTPGELRGSFTQGRLGALHANTDCGVFGVLSSAPEAGEWKPLPIGLRGDVSEGKATIICTVTPDGMRDSYEVEIIRIIGGDDNKSFIIRVTDKDLLALTGGIVQGMSGSPIIQNGKLIGAVTHVMVNDPTKGYGIFLENMLSSMT